tara:strand:+ start:147 stop:470 length:324 start_codon:yes stop_codon:yes gene_type:complete
LALRKVRDSQGRCHPEITISTLFPEKFDLSSFPETWGACADDIRFTPMIRQAGDDIEEEVFHHSRMGSIDHFIGCFKPFEIISVTAEGLISNCTHDFTNCHIVGDLN